MSSIEIANLEHANLEHAGRVAMGWSPESYDGKSRYRTVLMAFLPAVSILFVAVIFLVSTL